MKRLFFYSLIVSILLSGTNVSHADIINPDSKVEYTLLEPLPCVPTTGNNCVPGNTIPKFTINQFIEYVFKFAIALAVLIATIQVIIGGFEYMGEKSYASISSAKARFWNAGMGLAGALASFLILQTIDPRLVQVHTTIDPICPKEKNLAGQETGKTICDKASLDQFISQLDRDLDALGSENLTKIVELDNSIKETTKKIENLKNRYLYISDPNDPGYITKEEYELTLAKLDQELKGTQSTQAQLKAGTRYVAVFKQATKEMHRVEAYDISKEAGSFGRRVLNQHGLTLLENQIASINKVYNDYLQNPAIAHDPVVKPKLEFQRYFYVDQIGKESEYMQKLLKFNDTPPTTAVSGEGVGQAVGGTVGRIMGSVVTLGEKPNPEYPKEKTAIETLKTGYSNELAFLTSPTATLNGTLDTSLAKVKTDPFLLDQYTTLLNDRIKAIDTSISKKDAVLKSPVTTPKP